MIQFLTQIVNSIDFLEHFSHYILFSFKKNYLVKCVLIFYKFDKIKEY